jgi:predicted transcriptional regulator
MKGISIMLPDKVVAELYRLAKITGRSKTSLIEEAIRSFLWEEKFRKLRRVIGIKAASKKILTDDDVFKLIS